MMTVAFTGVLARKVSNKVLFVAGPVEDFLSAKVNYPLEEALKPTVEVKIKGTAITYTHIVRERGEMSFEQGNGTLDGDKIALKGEWTGEVEKYTASYTGAFVRRSAKLAGMQTWQHEGKTYTRKCEGAIKRPFAVFLPGEGPPEEKK